MTQPALVLDNLRKDFGKASIIRGVSLSVTAGERHAIIGPNGAGKSTLFHLISGRFPPSGGTVALHGRDITGRSPFAINRQGLARSFQVSNLFPRLSVSENIRCAVLWSSGYRYCFWRWADRLTDVSAKVADVLARIGLTQRRDVLAGVLTYAEQRALEIGIAIAGGADVVLLDEPTAGMSRSETSRAIDLIREVTVGKTLVMVEHDMSVVFDLADRISVLVYGAIIATGSAAEIRANKAVQDAYLGTLKPETPGNAD
ncbi:MAG: ABC transporter ATP-binding protein [Reyranella sp.]|uniref:ABC transporter ATP-binding protein n=1 Tax=Reyranella sp. TaxID=1929291 RepID=UPI00095FA47C|nr:ABC transporter ATP-binding protein [Reyranella sp.]MBN9538151.1 ABC transporter ATP-binding protein [Alphaproteobacteria bacterium]MBR2817860.1 ABC transporter ATP-binding protein [Reyranella sp.]OJU34067.1 MAG: ABC transporter ATP-binding protein [Alphaproteobacteria bacterium 65-37]